MKLQFCPFFYFINLDGNNEEDVLVMVDLVEDKGATACKLLEHLVGIEGVGVSIGQRRGVGLVV